jgi:putative ABC transport system permease protein
MKQFQLVINSVKHYFKSNLWVAFGVAITTAVLAGGLIVGDSVKYSLFQAASLRLGNVTHSITSGDRFFTTQLGEKLNEQEIESSSALKLEAVASASGGQLTLNKVEVWGVDENFTAVTETNSSLFNIEERTVSISQNVAQRLNIAQGDEILLRITKASLIPANAPFVSDQNQTVSYRTKVGKILETHEMGRLSLQHSQTAPFNIFMPISELNRLMETESKANTLLLSTQKSKSEIEDAIRLSYSLTDAQLSIVEAAATGEWELRSERVFIDDATINSVINSGLEHTPVLTYFSNYFRLNGKETPYSFVSSLPYNQLSPEEIVINTWLANDLGAQVGDTLQLGYFEIGALRELTEVEKAFSIKEIVDISGLYADRMLMPQIPGLSDAENCRDWETGVPVKLTAIRDKDEDYWYQYRGLPKAFVAIGTAQELWGNRFGNATALRFNQFEITKEELIENISLQINPFNLDLQLRAVKEESFMAAGQGTDFSQLFLGLSFFILAAGIILTALLFRFNLENRSSEIGTLSSLGFTDRKIRQLFLTEGLIVSLIGAALGLVLAIGYNKMVFWALNRVWNDIVRTEVLITKITPSTLLIGFLISVVAAMLTIHFTLRRKMKQQTAALQRRAFSTFSNKKKKVLKAVTLLSFIVAIVLVIFQLIGSNGNLNAASFFAAGGLLLMAFILFIFNYLTKQKIETSTRVSLQRIILQNIRLYRTRSITVVLLLAIGAFLVVSTGLNRKDLFSNANEPTGGTGGFLYWMETTVPVLHNLNNADYRNEQGFSTPFEVVQMQVAEGDDASCLNLNRVSNPRILGIDVDQLQGHFSVQTKIDEVDAQNFWQALTQKHEGCIPAIADQTVIQWGLGKKVGDTLVYQNALGDEVKLLLVAGLSASVFQGNVLIGNNNFLANFPTNSGSNVFLIDGEEENKTTIADDLLLLYRDFGIELTPAPQRLAEFMSVTNTYLSIFLVLGALGLLIGTIGLAIIQQRSLIERKAEFALLKSLGFTNRSVYLLITGEYVLLMFAGLLIGFVTAIVSVYPAIQGTVENISTGFVALLMAIIFVNGLLWIGLLAALQLRKLKLIDALRNE